MFLVEDIEYEGEEEWFDEEGEEDEFNETVILQDPEELESPAFLEEEGQMEEMRRLGATLFEEEEELGSEAFLEEEEIEMDIDPNLWHKRRLEATTHDELQDMEQTRANLLFHGEQFDVLPYLRCFNCAKIIGDKWEPFLEHVKEKLYKPEQIVDALPLDEDQRSALLDALDDPIHFQDLLIEYDAEQHYDELSAQRKYTNEQIFEQLNIVRPCCRQLFVSPIHIPIQQSAFKEPQKTTEISNPLMDVDADLLQLSLSGPEEGPSEPFEMEEIISLIPEIEPSPELQCSVKAPLKIISAAQLGTVKELRSDADLLAQFEVEDLQDLEAPVKKRKGLVPVGKQLSVKQKPRIYRAR